MEQLVLLVVIGLISLINWVMQKAAEKREQAQLERETKHESKRNVYTQPAPSPVHHPVRRAARPTQDPFKDLMDALGLPSDQLPPPVARREVIVEEEEFASVEDVVPPPIPEPVLSRQPTRPKPTVPFKPDRKMIELASAFAAMEEKPAAVYRGSKVRDLLANRDSQQKAVILAEILGTPRGLVSAGGHW